MPEQEIWVGSGDDGHPGEGTDAVEGPETREVVEEEFEECDAEQGESGVTRGSVGGDESGDQEQEGEQRPADGVGEIAGEVAGEFPGERGPGAEHGGDLEVEQQEQQFNSR